MSEKREPKVLTENDLRLIRQNAIFGGGISQARLDDLIHTIRHLRRQLAAP